MRQNPAPKGREDGQGLCVLDAPWVQTTVLLLHVTFGRLVNLSVTQFLRLKSEIMT